MDILIIEHHIIMGAAELSSPPFFNEDKFSGILQHKVDPAMNDIIITHFSEKMEYKKHIFLNNADLKNTFF